MEDKKELYMGNSLDDLRKYFEVEQSVFRRNLKMLLTSLTKIREAADAARLEGDEELSYIQYMKFMNILSGVQKLPDFKKEKELMKKMLGNNARITKDLDNLGILKNSLQKRYEEKTSQMRPIAESTRLDIEPDISEPPIQAPIRETISCIELNNMMEANEKILIMDCRPDTDYEQSRMEYQYSLSVPEAICTVAMTPTKIQNDLPNNSKVYWQLRLNRTLIILVDWSSTRYNRNSSVWYLWRFLSDYDQELENKTMLLLEGGYQRWKTTYPMKCHNPNYEPPIPIQDSSDFETIEYPRIDDIQMKNVSSPQIDRSSKYNAMKAHDKTKDELLNEKNKVLDRSLIAEKEMMELESNLTCITNDKENNEASTDQEQSTLFKIYQLQTKIQDFKTKEGEIQEQLGLKDDKDLTVPFTKTAQVEAEIHLKELEVAEMQENRRLKQNERLKALELARDRKPSSFGNVAPPNKAKRTDDLILTPKGLLNQGAEVKAPKFDRSSKPANTITRYEFNDQDFSPVYGRTERGLTGLKNLGNSCYMNSIIQCLSNTTSLSQYLLDNIYEKHVNRSNKTKGHIVRTLAAVIKMLWKGECKYISSKQLKGVIGEQDHLFYGTDQQDSHEFLIMLIDWLQSDLQTIPVQNSFDSLPPSEKAWLEYTKARESFILHLFYGQIKSTVKCTVCGNESSTYETFSNLSLELPPNNIDRCHITECFNMYFHGEKVMGWNCPRCKGPREAIKKLDISKLPPVLVIHLKRFYADQFTSSFKKKTIYVDFPLADLNMLPYVARTEKNTGSNLQHVYSLYAVSNHYGTMESGHYTAFCKNYLQRKWHKYDDHTVQSMDRSDARSSAAYILFYTSLTDSSYTGGR